ncbi:VOC family protein [Bacillus salipaludis]|uniref:VOC family protein n=1 Tax=Bacillus salipaludis TaxID=2547811 RepID=A0ABW8RJB6_9BACI
MSSINYSEVSVAWRGFHHVALATPNLDETINFYTKVLGMQASEIFPGRHVFIKPGMTDSWGIHFFEKKDAQLFTFPGAPDPLKLERNGFAAGFLQHIAFALPNEEFALILKERLGSYGVLTTDITNIGPIRNLLFYDIHGLLLEATWPA